MRPISPTDLSWVARYLTIVPPSLRFVVCHSLFDRIHVADKVRKRLGQSGCFGTGTITSCLATEKIPPEPFANDIDFAHAIMIVANVILERHQDDTCH